MAQIIQLLTVENTLSRKKTHLEQHVVFLIQTAKLNFGKQVDVIWSGEDGKWQSLSASYLANRGQDQEYWQARFTIMAKSKQQLPGNIQFALRLSSADGEFWDNQQGDNYHSKANTGLELCADSALQNLALSPHLENGKLWFTIKVAVNKFLGADSVSINWTTDDWQHSHRSKCRSTKPSKTAKTQIWTARLRVGQAFRIQYSICCKTRHRELWDNNGGANYLVSRSPLKVLILNLHCYQEQQQDQKFSQIAQVIDELAVDVVCLQEVAEFWHQGQGDWASNSANIINQRLQNSMHLFHDWSHLGFDKFREGVAILSRFPLKHCQSAYVSESQDFFSIHSRKVVKAEIEPPYFGSIAVFSAHLSWWEDGFQQQFQRLSDWATAIPAKSTLLCGDFNITAGSKGYKAVVETKQYEDQYLAANAVGLFEKIFRVNDPHWHNYPTDDYRIDYIFMHKDSNLRVNSARVLFTEQDYGRVSDHCGYLMSFEPT